jgi:hypothetical protein
MSSSGIKDPVATSQETNNLSATELSRLMILRFEVFTVIAMKNAVFWDLKAEFVPHRRHITPWLQRPCR